MKAKLEEIADDKTLRKGIFVNRNDKEAKKKINVYISTAINMLAEERFTE